jgi:two-component system, OmpR family, sensor histidine kinase MtrB
VRLRPGRTRSLRFRVTAVFALGGLVLSAVVALLAYTFSEHYLVRQRERSLQRQAYLDARVLRDDVQRTGDVAAGLATVERSVDSSVVLSYGGDWLGTSVAVGRDQVPDGLRRLVESGEPARQRVRVNGEAWFIVGFPIAALEVDYYEAFKFEELDRTLGVLRASLLGSAALATVLGGLIGLWASRRLARPVAQVAAASERVASGDLDTRLAPQADRDLDRLVASFNRMVDALGQRIDRDARFVSDVSHELRSPLTAVAAAAEVLRGRRDEIPERSRVALDLLTAEIDRLRLIVEDLLELSRADAGVDELELEPVEFGEQIRQTLGRGDEVARVEVDPGLAGTPVLVDKRRLDRVLLNLFENARAHGGGVTAVAVRRSDGVVRIVVDDSGPGVAEPERSRIFERFARGAASGQRRAGSGSGLGLALVAEHVRVQGGRVWVEDPPDRQGARFVVELPWRPA